VSGAGKLARAGRAVESFYLGPVSVHHVTCLRIAFGAIMFLQYLTLLPVMDRIFGPAGLVSFLSGPSWVLEHSAELHRIQLALSLCFMFGLFSRLSGVAIAVIHATFHIEQNIFTWGDGSVGHAFVFYVSLSNPGARLSLDRWLRRRLGRERPPIEQVAAWPLRLLQIHVTAIYFMAAWNRLGSPGWRRGRMTYVALTSSVFGRFPDVHWSRFHTPLWIATWYTLISEAFAPLFLWLRKTRTVWAVGLILMHIGLELTSTICWWQFYMIACLTTFLPARWLGRIVERLERSLGWAFPETRAPEAVPRDPS
jgi:hypothetical protein